MGAVFDEVTGQEPSCTVCGSKDYCPHQVAVIDRTFADCVGGVLYETIDKLRETLSVGISAKIKASQNVGVESSDDYIASIVREAVEDYDPEYPDDIYIDENIFLAWLIEALIDAGAERHPGAIVEEGGPGQSSSLTLLYANDPKSLVCDVTKVLEDAITQL